MVVVVVVVVAAERWERELWVVSVVLKNMSRWLDCVVRLGEEELLLRRDSLLSFGTSVISIDRTVS